MNKMKRIIVETINGSIDTYRNIKNFTEDIDEMIIHYQPDLDNNETIITTYEKKHVVKFSLHY